MSPQGKTELNPAARLLACLLKLLALASISSLCWAQPASLSREVQFNIAAQSLSSAIIQFSDQAGIQIISSGNDVTSVMTEGVIGKHSIADALAALLRGTALRYTVLNDQTVSIRPQGSSSLATDTNTAANVEEVIVTAQKREERLQDVPVPVSVINAETLSDTGRVLLRDYYTSVPGLSVAPNIETTQMLAIRGVTTGSFSIPTVGVMIDDAPYGGSTNSGAGNNVPDIDPGDLERIEVLRGPQGTLYGANTMGGLVKYVTKDPSTEGFSGRFEAGFDHVQNGSEPGFSLRASANIPLGNTLAVRVSGFERQDAGYIDNTFTNRKGVNQIDASGGRLAALWKPSDSASLKVSALYQELKGQGLDEIDVGAGLGDLQQNYVAGVDRYNTINEAFSAALKVRFAGVDLTSVSSYGSSRGTSPFDFTPYYGQSFQTLYNGNYGAPWITFIDLRKFSQEVRLSGQIGHSFEWLVGGFYTDERSAHAHQVLYVDNPTTGVTVAENILRKNPTLFSEYAAFADLTYHVTDRFDVQIGARQSHSKETDGQYETYYLPLPVTTTSASGSTTGNPFTYLLTPRFQVSTDLMVYARLASGYRPGGPNAFAAGAPPSYAPDKTYNYEAGFKGSFLENRLSVDASVYYIDWKNIQLTLFTPPPTVFSYGANGSAAKSEGVELSVEAKPASGLTINGWIDYDNAVLTQAFPAASTAYGVPGYRLPNTPRLSGQLSVEQDFVVVDGVTGFVGGDVNYVGTRVGLFTSTALRQTYPDYTKTDVRAGVKFNSWTVSAYVNNLADIRGLTSGGIGYVLPYAFAVIQPRTVGLAVARKF